MSSAAKRKTPSSSPDGKKQKTGSVKESLESFMNDIKRRDGHEPEFMQAVEEVVESLQPVFEGKGDLSHSGEAYLEAFKRLVEPERVVSFRVAWTDDAGATHVNRGFRVQFNQALGPYKGGLRFHPSVTQSVVKFLGFEQIFKNSLTTLNLGGGKGGSDFDPRGRSDAEVMRFCQSFMTELSRHIGGDRDVPAGDIGVGGREIGYLFGQYKRLTTSFEGVLTGKGAQWGGSLLRPEATGYGVVYFAKNIIDAAGMSIEGKTCLVSGSGNVAQYTVEKLLDLGAKPVTLSDSQGTVHEPEGFTREKLAEVMELKNKRRGRLSEYADAHPSAKYYPGQKPWQIPGDFAFPSATQNEIEDADAEALIANGCKGVFEGANMPSTNTAIAKFKKAGVKYAPAKAANAGGVAVSGLEMAQNSQRLGWTREVVDERLQGIMKSIFDACTSAAEAVGLAGDLQAGANIAGFLRVADAMIDQGVL